MQTAPQQVWQSWQPAQSQEPVMAAETQQPGIPATTLPQPCDQPQPTAGLQTGAGPSVASVPPWGWPPWMAGPARGHAGEQEPGDRDRDPCPPFDGVQPERTLRPWLRATRFWRKETVTPLRKQGIKVYKALTVGSIARHAADNLSDDQITSENGFVMIMAQIRKAYAIFLELEEEISISEALYMGHRHHNMTMTEYTAEKGFKLTECEKALKEKLPSKFWGTILKRHADMNAEQKVMFRTWTKGSLEKDTVIENLQKLDQVEQIMAMRNGGGSSRDVATMLQHDSGDQQIHESEPSAWTGPGGFEDEAAEEDDEFISNPADEDDDGNFLVDETGEVLIDAEKGRVYDEGEFTYLVAYAESYRDVRKKLNESRNGRGFLKTPTRGSFAKSLRQVRRDGGKPGRKGKEGFSKGGKNRQSGRSKTRYQVTRQNLGKQVRCWGCNEVGHLQRNCPKNSKSLSSGGFAGLVNYEASGVKESRFGPMTAGGYSMNLVAIRIQIWSTFGEILAGHFLVDAGAQDGVVGHSAWLKAICRLKELGCFPHYAKKAEGRATCSGVGGGASLLGQAEIPCRLCGVDGVLLMHAVKDQPGCQVQGLIPVALLSVLEIDVCCGKGVLCRRGVEYPVHQLNSGHLSYNVFSFAASGWTMPVQYRLAWRLPEQDRHSFELNRGLEPRPPPWHHEVDLAMTTDLFSRRTPRGKAGGRAEERRRG